MDCYRCKTWIMPGYEVAYQKQVFHDKCATAQVREDKEKDRLETEEAARKARQAFKLIIGRK
jgi:hypothetical protein